MVQCHYCSHAYAGTARAVGYNPLMTSYPHIEKYHADLERFIEFGGSDNQQSIRRAFAECLDSYCREHRERLALVDELSISASNKPDGTVKDSLRMARGYWEAKDSHDDLDAEIQAKFNRGTPGDVCLGSSVYNPPHGVKYLTTTPSVMQYDRHAHHSTIPTCKTKRSRKPTRGRP